jgi:hypothetical protein
MYSEVAQTVSLRKLLACAALRFAIRYPLHLNLIVPYPSSTRRHLNPKSSFQALEEVVNGLICQNYMHE